MAIPYSNSRMESFNTCPRQYKFQYIEKAVVEKPVGVEAFLGDAVHRTLEKLYIFRMNGRLQPQDELLDYYHKYWEGPDKERIKVTRIGLGVDDYIRVGAEALVKYYRTNTPFDDSEVLALEKKISFPLDPDGRFVINGKVDRISRRHDGLIEIVDYKTAASLPAQQSLNDNNQMGLYNIGVKYLWPDFGPIELKQIYLRQGAALTTQMDDDKLEEIRYRAFQKILEIERAKKEDNFPPHESALCEWCVFYELCPAKRHKLALEKETGEEFNASCGEELAAKYLKLSHEKKVMDSELDALKQDIIKFCEANGLTRLDASGGYVKLSINVSDAFPTKTDDETAYLEISHLVRAAGLDECFKLDQNVLYKEFFIREKLNRELAEKLRNYLVKKQRAIVHTSYENQ